MPWRTRGSPALRVGQERRGRLLDELLEAALQRAVAGAGDDDVAVLVGEDLGLDVARLVEVALDEALAATEGRDGLAGGRLEELGDLLDGAGDLHAAAATAEGGLDRDGTPYSLANATTSSASSTGSGVPGTSGAFALAAMWRAVTLSPRSRIDCGLGPDPDQPRVDDGLGEIGVLRKEAVAGVDRVGAGLGRCVEQLVEVEVGLRGGLAAERERLIGKPDVRRVGVGFGVDGDARPCRRPWPRGSPGPRSRRDWRRAPSRS